jgi:hypothetical protein
MSSVVQEIQVIHALRKNIRDLTISPALLKSIESIHHSIHSSAEQNGWKTVDWRGPARAPRDNGRQHGRRDQGKGAERTRQDAVKSGVQDLFEPHNRRMQSHTSQSQSQTHASQSQMHSHASQPHASHSQDHPSATDGFRPPFHQKYVSKFKKSSDKVEDTILNTILLGKLNKFSAPNYPEIKEFITHIIDSGQTDMINCFMKLVFEKAASEEVFCPLYARLLSELSAQYPVLLTEMANLYTQYMEIFEEVTDPTEENYNELCKRNVEKKYRRGYSQFLAELIKHDVIDPDTFMKIIMKIISQVELGRTVKANVKLNEEFADCLMKIMKAIRAEDQDSDASDGSDASGSEDKIQVIRATLKQDIAARIQPLSMSNAESAGISNKARFTFLDLYESIQRF